MLRYFQNLLSPAESVISYFWQNSLVNMVFIYIYEAMVRVSRS